MLITTKEAAELIGISEVSLRRKRSAGGGPDYVVRNCRRIRYDIDVVRRWIRDNPKPKIGRPRRAEQT